MALSPRLLSWILLCVYCTVTATEAHLSPQRRQLVLGRPSFYRRIYAPTQTFNVATPAETFETPASANRTVGRDVADIVGEFLSNAEGANRLVKILNQADGTGSSLLQSHIEGSLLDNGNMAIAGGADSLGYKLDTAIVSGGTDNGGAGVGGREGLGNSNGFGNSILNIFQNLETFRTSRNIRRSVGSSEHRRRYLPKVRYAKQRRQDLSNIQGDLVNLELLGGIVGSPAPAAASSPPSSGTSTTVNDPNFQGSSASPAAAGASPTGGASSGAGSGSQPAATPAGASSSPSASAPSSGTKTDSGSSASPASPAALRPGDNSPASPQSGGVQSGSPTTGSSSTSANPDNSGGDTPSSSTDPDEDGDGTSSSTPAAGAPPRSAASPAADAAASTPSSSSSAANTSGSPSSDSTTSTDATSGNRASSPKAWVAAAVFDSQRSERADEPRRKSPRQLSRSRRGLASPKVDPGATPVRRQLYHPRRGSESRRAGLSPRYMHRTRPYYERSQDSEETIVPSQFDGDLDSDTSTLGEGVSTQEVSGTLQQLFRRYLPSWMNFSKRREHVMVHTDEDGEKDDGGHSIARRFYAKTGTIQPRQLTRRGQGPAGPEAGETPKDVESRPSAFRDIPHPRLRLTETNRRHDKIPSDPMLFEEQSLNYRRAIPHPKGVVRGQWAAPSSSSSNRPRPTVASRYPPSFRIRRQAASAEVNKVVGMDKRDMGRGRQEPEADTNRDVGVKGKHVEGDEPGSNTPPARPFVGPSLPHPKIAITNLNTTRPMRREERGNSVTDDLTSFLADGISIPPNNLAAEVPPSLGSSRSSSTPPAAGPTPTASTAASASTNSPAPKL